MWSPRHDKLHISSAEPERPVGYFTSFNFNLVQRALVLEDYALALGVGGGGFVSRKKGARSMGEEKKEGKNNNNNK